MNAVDNSDEAHNGRIMIATAAPMQINQGGHLGGAGGVGHTGSTGAADGPEVCHLARVTLDTKHPGVTDLTWHPGDTHTTRRELVCEQSWCADAGPGGPCVVVER
jgi:hypothetical protein